MVTPIHLVYPAQLRVIVTQVGSAIAVISHTFGLRPSSGSVLSIQRGPPLCPASGGTFPAILHSKSLLLTAHL